MMYQTPLHIAEIMAQENRNGRRFDEAQPPAPGSQPEERKARNVARAVIALAALVAAAAIAL